MTEINFADDELLFQKPEYFPFSNCNCKIAKETN